MLQKWVKQARFMLNLFMKGYKSLYCLFKAEEKLRL